MAGGWAQDGAAQEQIDASTDDAVKGALSQLPSGDSLINCEECDMEIPIARRNTLKSVRLCVSCQSKIESTQKETSAYNRRGSKDGQLR